MRFVIDLDSLELIESATDRRKVTQVEGKRGDDSPFEVVFVRSGIAEELDADSILSFGAKRDGKYDASAVVFNNEFSLAGTGESAKYTANPSFNTLALNDLFLMDGDDSNDLPYVDLMAEFSWQVGTGAPTSTKTFRFRVHNDVIRDDETSPTPAYSPIGTTAPLNGGSWTARDSDRSWRAVASSADGTKLVAAASGGQLYTSTDSGATWTARESARSWQGVASSADGTKLVAGVVGGQLYTSTDSGATWTARESARSWRGVASSSDGAKLVAVVYGGHIYTSTDSGATWTARDSARKWYDCAMTSDGSKLFACGGLFSGEEMQIYYSSDGGVNWTATESSRLWDCIACSSDGLKVLAATRSGQLYTLINGVATAAPPYLRVAGGFLYIQEAGVWKKTALSAL